ncbi:unnamed protein product [Staurois parvus]|uniref:Uncharacterized protein n=1 Tax=Staurois parvus TaxID=386267 RepID=A0ABN9B069_9NEOB|nr:unnamed protein product [Staurois parvus]
MFDPVFFDPPFLSVSSSYLLIRHIVWRHCTCSIWCVFLEVFCFVFFSWESACDQHCPDRGQGFYILLEKKNSSYKL